MFSSDPEIIVSFSLKGGLEREVSDYRTSSTAWLMPDMVDSDPVRGPVVRDLEQRIAEVVGLPKENQEHFQVLRYGTHKATDQYLVDNGWLGKRTLKVATCMCRKMYTYMQKAATVSVVEDLIMIHPPRTHSNHHRAQPVLPAPQ